MYRIAHIFKNGGREILTRSRRSRARFETSVGFVSEVWVRQWNDPRVKTYETLDGAMKAASKLRNKYNGWIIAVYDDQG